MPRHPRSPERLRRSDEESEPSDLILKPFGGAFCHFLKTIE
jgi:hypothetical protein